VESELDRLRKKVENFPSASLYNRLAELARDAGSIDEAEDVCRRCMREFPRNGHSYVILAAIEAERGQREDSLKLLRAAIERDPRSVSGYLMLGNLHFQDKDYVTALGFLKQAVAIKPNDAQVLSRISEIEKIQAASPPSPGSSGSLTPTGSKVFGGEPLVPFSGPMTTAIKAASIASSGSRTAALDALCGETGVRGALVADWHGRVVVAKNLEVGQDELLAALSSEIAKSSMACQSALGSEKLTTWALTAGAGQVLAFQRDKAFSVVVLADTTVRPAMLELRARQTLIDLGTA
jgi:tetratricopeptide (TPR) repeat protein